MAILNLHDLDGKNLEVETQSMIDCIDLPEYTELTIIKQNHCTSHVQKTERIVLKVKEKRLQMLKTVMAMPLTAVLPNCLIREKPTFEKIRAERRARGY